MSEVVHCHRCDILDLAPGTTECFGCEQPPLRDTACETCEGTGYCDAENWHENEVQDCPDCGSTGRREGRTVTITIPGTPAYSLSPNSRSHWAVKRKETEAAGWSVRLALSHRAILQFNRPVRLHWTIYLTKGDKKRDMTNIIPTLKAHEDYLVRFGVLTGDSPTCIPQTPTVAQIPWSEHKGDPRIVVRIQEVNG